MFKKLFGGGGGPTAPAAKPAPTDPSQTIERLENQCDTINKRIKVFEQRIKDAKATALTKKKAGDQRGAVMALKQMKMFEGELTKLDGQQIMLEQQKMTIQSTHADVDVVNSLRAGNQAIGTMNQQMDVDSIADLQDEMAENMQEVQERQDLFAAAAEEGKDDLLNELDEMEADALMGELDGMEVNAMPISPEANSTYVPIAPQPTQQTEEAKQMASLMAMM